MSLFPQKSKHQKPTSAHCKLHFVLNSMFERPNVLSATTPGSHGNKPLPFAIPNQDGLLSMSIEYSSRGTTHTPVTCKYMYIHIHVYTHIYTWMYVFSDYRACKQLLLFSFALLFTPSSLKTSIVGYVRIYVCRLWTAIPPNCKRAHFSFIMADCFVLLCS